MTLRYIACSWAQLTVLMQHFYIHGNWYPSPSTKQEVFNDLKVTQTNTIVHKGLQLQDWFPVDEKIGDDQIVHEHVFESGLTPLISMETIDSLVLHLFTRAVYSPFDLIIRNPAAYLFPRSTAFGIPDVLKNNIWPKLNYLELDITDFNITDIMKLKDAAPNLKYLKFYFPYGVIPDAVWTIDWDMLPWKTGVIYRAQNILSLDLICKVITYDPPPIHFLFWQNSYSFSCNKKQNLFVDLSNNHLTNRDYFHFSFETEYDLHLNFSNNNFLSVNILEKFSFQTIFDQRVNVFLRTLDLSHNNLDNTQLSSSQSDFLNFTEIRELYLHHNRYTYLPHYQTFPWKIYTLANLKELQILDLSHNSIVDYRTSEVVSLPYDCNFINFNYDEFSQIREIYFQYNELTYLTDYVYQAKHLTVADFSYNKIPFGKIWPKNVTVKSFIPSGSKTIYLQSDYITVLDFSVLKQSVISQLHHILQNFHLHLDGSPLNCSCDSHTMFKYLISFSRTERLNENLDENHLPDFSFYETHWKCQYPNKWAGIPIMQIPENKYDKMCVENLDNCPPQCHCYTSWRRNYQNVMECTNHRNTLRQLPEYAPKNTSYLLLAQNDITTLCRTRPYFTNLVELDLSGNSLNEICYSFFNDLENLKQLNLANNKIRTIPLEIDQMRSLTTLTLTNNLLEELPESVQQMNSLTFIEISGNFFRCDCDTFWMTGWLIKSISIVQNPRGLICFSGKGRGKRLINLHQEGVGCNEEIIHALIGLVVAVVIMAVLVGITYKYRRFIKIWLYTRYGFHPWDNVEENSEEKDYDAFVSYCRKDVDWVLNTLLPYLEAPQCGYHLCVHERDFVPGVAITKNIMTAIQYSRRTIMVLSPDFIKSGWCDLEFQAAHRRALEDRSNFLIVVILKEVDNKDLDKTLHLYMKTNTYVSASDNWFWQKMLYAMPKVPIYKIKEQNNDKHDNQPISNQGHYNAAVMINEHDNINNPNLEDEGNNNVNDIANNSTQSGASSDETEISSDSDAEVAQTRVYRRTPRRNMVARLPPLFKRIHTYNDVMRDAEDDGQVPNFSHSDLDIAKTKKEFLP